jgi:hypothetical protein
VDVLGHYLGRTCPWKDCRPGVRSSCDALYCGRRAYLQDDLATLRLSDEVVASAAAQVWLRVNRVFTEPAFHPAKRSLPAGQPRRLWRRAIFAADARNKLFFSRLRGNEPAVAAARRTRGKWGAGCNWAPIRHMLKADDFFVDNGTSLFFRIVATLA